MFLEPTFAHPLEVLESSAFFRTSQHINLEHFKTFISLYSFIGYILASSFIFGQNFHSYLHRLFKQALSTYRPLLLSNHILSFTLSFYFLKFHIVFVYSFRF